MKRTFELCRPLYGLPVLVVMLLTGCEGYNPDANTPTSGHLVLLVEDAYAPLMRELADTFMLRSPAARVTVEPMSARPSVIELIDRTLNDTARSDTAASLAIVVGRPLLDDERTAIDERDLTSRLKTIPIAYDGLVALVATNSRLRETTVERLREALTRSDRTEKALQDGGGSQPVRVLLTNPNSSASWKVRAELLRDSTPASPWCSYTTLDSVIDAVAEGKGIGITGWYGVRKDSNRIRPLKMGFTDTSGVAHPPVRVHTATLVMNTYPLKLSINGYTFDGVNSLGNGFLTWLATSQNAQEYLANKGLEPKNLRFRFIAE